MQKERKRLFGFLIIAVIASFFLFSCAEKEGGIGENRIVSVCAAENGEITVTAELSDETVAEMGENGRVYLFALMPGESVSGIGEMTPVSEKRADSRLSFTLDRDESTIPLLYAKYVLAAVKGGKYTVVSPAAYVENPQIFAKSFFHSSPLSKKGLSDVSAGEAEELFVSQTVIDVPVDIMLNCEHGGESCGIGVETYKVCNERVALLDHQVRTFSDAGITVYLRFVIDSHSGAERALPLAAVTSFLCERYGASVGDVILAFDLGAPVCDIHTTAALLRAFNTAAYNANGGVNTYFSVSCIFNTTEGGGSRVLLTDLFEALSYNGQIPFGIAVDMSAAALLDSSVWNDPIAVAELSTPYVTVRNLEILADFLHGEEFLYDSVNRKLLVTDFSVRSEGEKGEEIQAAAIAFGFYKSLAVDSVAGIIYSRCEDGDDTAGLRNAAGKKQSYGVFSALNTAKAENATEFALKLIGVNRWAAVTGSFVKPEAAYVKEYPKLQYAAEETKLKEKLLFDFSGGVSHGFYPSDGANSLEMAENEDGFLLKCVLDPEYAGYGGVSARISPDSLKKARTLYAELEIEKGSGVSEIPVRIVISGVNNGKGQILSAEGIVNCGSRIKLAVDIEPLDTIDRIKVLCDGGMEETELTLYSVSYGYKPVSAFLIVTLVILGLGVLFGLFVFVLYLRMLYYRRKQRMRKRKLMEERKITQAKRAPARRSPPDKK